MPLQYVRDPRTGGLVAYETQGTVPRLPPRLPVQGQVTRLSRQSAQLQRGLAGGAAPGMGDFGFLGDDVVAQPSANPAEAFGLPPQDLINSLYDIFGKYPRKNVLPYAFSFSLLQATGNALTPLGVQHPVVTITADAAHICTMLTGASTGEYSVFMRTDSSDRQLMQYPIHSAAMVGTAERPFNLPKPLMLAPNTSVSFDITDLSNAANEVWFTLWGFKVYRRQYAAAG